MIEGLHRLVYRSRNCIGGVPEATARGIYHILAASRRHNARAGVTGALLFNAGCFAQVLEGPQAAVERVFERIRRDERHDEVAILGSDAVAQRAFASWSMAFAGSSPEDAVRYGAIAGETGFDPARLSADALCETLHRLALEAEHARV